MRVFSIKHHLRTLVRAEQRSGSPPIGASPITTRRAKVLLVTKKGAKQLVARHRDWDASPP